MSEPKVKPVGFRRPSDVIGEEAAAELGRAGWEIVRKTTETKRRHDAAVAAMRAYWAEQDRESALRWGREEARRVRHLEERCNFLYQKATEHGASRDELAQP